jgi:hypothetical protein
MNKITTFISTVAAWVSALIMLQTLYFKFTAASESVYIFAQLGMEPVGRIGVGMAELASSVLLLLPKTRLLGALLGIGIMAGAIIAHLTKIGIEVMEDGGYLFTLCLIVFVGCFTCIYSERRQITLFLKRVFTSR